VPILSSIVPPAMSRTDAAAFPLPSYLSVKVLGRYTILRIGTPPERTKQPYTAAYKSYRRSFNEQGELLYGGLILLIAPCLFIYFSLNDHILFDGTALFLKTLAGGAIGLRLFAMSWIGRISYQRRQWLQDPMLLAIFMPALSLIVAGIHLSALDEDERSRAIAERRRDQAAGKPEPTEEILPIALPEKTVPQTMPAVASTESIAAQKKRMQELEEAELARIAS
jgi:hypothetical protein